MTYVEAWIDNVRRKTLQCRPEQNTFNVWGRRWGDKEEKVIITYTGYRMVAAM